MTALALFVLPSGSFALTYVLGGLGHAFHASIDAVSIASGTGMTAGGLAGSLSLPLLARHLRPAAAVSRHRHRGRIVYLEPVAAAACPTTFAVAIVGENVSESLALTAILAISFETIGQGNPRAATIYSILNAASSFSVDSMAAIDGHAFQSHGLLAAFGVDALAGIVSCLALVVLIRYVSECPATVSNAWRSAEDRTDITSRVSARSHRFFSSFAKTSSQSSPWATSLNPDLLRRPTCTRRRNVRADRPSASALRAR
ncbi:MAG TPA: hypothetical protein VF292_14100 [Rhodanobacteraceae bacterium]